MTQAGSSAMNQERRIHERVKVECSFVMKIHGLFCRGKTRNVSNGGVLARITEGDLSKYEEKDKGMCRIVYNGNGCNFDCLVIRMAGDDIALMFDKMDDEQRGFTRTVIEDES